MAAQANIDEPMRVIQAAGGMIGHRDLQKHGRGPHVRRMIHRGAQQSRTETPAPLSWYDGDREDFRLVNGDPPKNKTTGGVDQTKRRGKIQLQADDIPRPNVGRGKGGRVDFRQQCRMRA